MPPLKRPRQELFVRNLINGAKKGISQRQAYVQAGYEARGDYADACASRLASSVKVRDRMDELAAPAVRKTRVSVESLLAELSTTIEDARAAKQHSVVVTALTLSAKLVGLLKDQIEVGGPGAFNNASSPEGVIDAVIEDAGGDPRQALADLDRMREMLEARISETARDVTPAL
jgi:hypothetical protein